MDEVKTKKWLPIDKGIPIPPLLKTGIKPGQQPTAQWKRMEIGDSIFFAGKHKDQIAPLASNSANAYGYRFTCRVVEGGVRVRRVE